ncbi:phospholipase D-like domain-containing protein [Tabrizicola sp.]|uniref:phospholipase D family protein n=1 Tax=Tabrizicola sp. TaxID=2005166 RepID=UPI001A643972|nr:phospholipase D-like domain-containing protein [Tabrizicola sp.]MBL9072772.1 phospholipase [Tabrizicola sp.]
MAQAALKPVPDAPEVEVLVTAAEAYPALERAFLSARAEIVAGFRVFDLKTRLRSPEALAIGQSWFDLLIHTLRRGISIRIVLSDFDPVARPRLHRATWRTVRMFWAAAELAGPEARLAVVPSTHSAVAGIWPRLLFWPVVQSRLARVSGWLRRQLDAQRMAALREMPGVRRMLAAKDAVPRPRLLAVPPLFPATHHQKLAVFDGETVYIGGLDLDERFYDTPEHRLPGHETWHDVQLMIRGAVAGDARTHLARFLGIIEGSTEADPPAPAREGLRFVRTLSRRRRRGAWRFISPEPVVHEIEAAHAEWIAQAEGLIYIETQYFRSRRMARRLAKAARERPGLKMILILPAAPDDVAFEGATGLDARLGEFLQAKCLRILRRGFGRRLFVGGAAQPRRTRARGRAQLKGAPLVYIHAKVSIFDDRAAIVSSANLNGRSLRWDTEAGVVMTAPQDVAALRRRLMAHWLPDGAGADFFDPSRAMQAWWGLAARNARLPPDRRRGFLLPYNLRSAEDFGRAFPLVPDEMV